MEDIFNRQLKKQYPDYGKKYPKGMINFINIWIESYRQNIENNCSKGGKYYNENKDMRIVYYIYLIINLLNTQFEDKSIYKHVNDLPIYDKYLIIDCLGFNLGMNPHNGNVHLLQIVKKYNLL